MKTTYSIAVVFVFVTVFVIHAADHMKAFPVAEEGMTRCVLALPKLEDESARRVELIVGKNAQVDEQNTYFFGGKIERSVIQGWGYSQYTVSKLGPMAGTLIAVDPNVPKVDRFITLGGEPYLIRYNSRLPIVVYVPNDAEARYRIWSAGNENNKIDKG